ncbi:hypothetical protein AC249_AIPGENE11076 [Exaiptasia diaphana]|nr:hypothetical protein AC249_AIPGENE11076 [Exaiptasia diaphana]
MKVFLFCIVYPNGFAFWQINLSTRIIDNHCDFCESLSAIESNLRRSWSLKIRVKRYLLRSKHLNATVCNGKTWSYDSISLLLSVSRSGSVIVYFNLTLVANVSDPLLPLKEAVTKGGGNLSGLVIDPSSIQAGTPTTPIPTTTPTTTPITTPSPISEEAIIAIAVVVPIVVILIIVLVWYFCCKKKGNRVEENISLEEGSPYRPVNGEENRGLSESQTSYARSGPKADHNGQPTNNNPDTGDAMATYAAVDMSKKKDKSKTKDSDV